MADQPLRATEWLLVAVIYVPVHVVLDIALVPRFASSLILGVFALNVVIAGTVPMLGVRLVRSG
jgi:hypothetical protein